MKKIPTWLKIMIIIIELIIHFYSIYGIILIVCAIYYDL